MAALATFMAPLISCSASTPDDTWFTSKPPAIDVSDLEVANLRAPSDELANHYNAVGTIGNWCAVALAKFNATGVPVYEYNVALRADHTVVIERGRAAPAEQINALAKSPPPRCA